MLIHNWCILVPWSGLVILQFVNVVADQGNSGRGSIIRPNVAMGHLRKICRLKRLNVPNQTMSLGGSSRRLVDQICKEGRRSGEGCKRVKDVQRLKFSVQQKSFTKVMALQCCALHLMIEMHRLPGRSGSLKKNSGAFNCPVFKQVRVSW